MRFYRWSCAVIVSIMTKKRNGANTWKSQMTVSGSVLTERRGLTYERIHYAGDRRSDGVRLSLAEVRTGNRIDPLCRVRMVLTDQRGGGRLVRDMHERQLALLGPFCEHDFLLCRRREAGR